MNICRLLRVFLLLACTLQIAFFPSLANIIGCLSSIFALIVYEKAALNPSIIYYRPFSFIAVSCLFLFMYLPPIATIIDGNPMIHNMETPVETFLLQTLYYIITISAFTLAGKWSIKDRKISQLFYRIGYFNVLDARTIWILAFLGLLPKIYLMINQFGEDLTEGAGTANMLAMLTFLPICLLYKNLYGGSGYVTRRWIVFVYITVLSIINIGTNSRNAIISLFLTWGIIHFIHLIRDANSLTLSISAKKFVIVFVLFFLAIGPLSRLSSSMIFVRNQRSDMNAKELIVESIEMYRDDDRYDKAMRLMESINQVNNQEHINIEWNEAYVDNLFLHRLCNYRIVDNSIYYANMLGYMNSDMIDEFICQLKLMYPQPIVNLFFGNLDRNKHSFSMMDHLTFLLMSRPSSFLVGGDVGLGLSVFGYFFFFIVFFVYICLFFLFDQMVIFRNGEVVCPAMSLILVYSVYFECLEVANGISNHLSFLLWGFWFRSFIFGFINKFASYRMKIK